MPIFDIYSRRKRRAAETEPDVYQYDKIPDALRVQVRRIFEDAIGMETGWGGGSFKNNLHWTNLRDLIAREQGRLTLAGKTEAYADVLMCIHNEQNTDYWLDLVECGALTIESSLDDQYERNIFKMKQRPRDAIEELNFRFREAGVGYQYTSGHIVRVDSQYVHAEVVLPALQLLSDKRFAGAQDEFLSAHAHYRAGEYKDCVTDCLNAFESTLKALCDAKSWPYPKGVRASDLIKIVRAKGLLPDYLDNSFDQLIATLQAGLPKVRNEAGGHGQGAQPKETPGYVAAYALHLAAAKIVLLVEAFKASK